MITIQKYVRAQSLEEAYTLNLKRRNRIVGGMMWMRLGRGSIDTAIDLCDLGLDHIEETEDRFIMGAMVTLRALEQHASLNAYTNGAVRNALESIVGVQFRNMATLGGSFWGRFGFSDVLTVLLAMDTYVELYKGGTVSLEDFLKMKYDNDILVHVIIKKSPLQIEYASMRNQRTDFPVLACAVSCVNGEYRASVGARPAKAILIRDEKAMLAKGITKESAKAFAEYVAESVPTGSNLRGSAAYRTHLTGVLTERSVLKLGGMEHGN